MNDKVVHVPMEDEFRICPSCGYQDGFHSMFKKKGEVTQWLFICPACQVVFDIDLRV